MASPPTVQLVFTDFLDLSFGLTSSAILPLLEVATPSGDYLLERSVSATTLKNVFYFYVDQTITSYDNPDLYDSSFTKYFVDVSSWSTTIASDLNPMSYQVTTGAFGNNSTDNLGKHFLRYLAQSLFGTYLGVDLFQNEDEVYMDISGKSYTYVYTEVLNKLKKVDKNFGQFGGLADIKTDATLGYHMQDASGSYNICRTLVRQIAQHPNARERFQALETTYKKDGNDNLFSVPFIAGDSIFYSVMVSPSPTQGQVTGVTILPKKYILKLNVVA